MDDDAAPGRLEGVRAFLNTWSVPNDTRAATDALPALVRDRDAWTAALPGLPAPSGRGAGSGASLGALRDDLRAALAADDAAPLQPRLDGVRWRPVLVAGTVRVEPHRDDTASRLLAAVVEAVGAGSWARLRACPDCGWVFYDSSRNARRTWCSMTAGPGRRGCGAIAKTRAYRSRHRDAVRADDDR